MSTLKVDQNFRSPEGHVKRPMNAFMIFAKENRCKVRLLYPSFSNSQISETLGNKWNAMSSGEKLTYHMQAKALELEHRKLYPEYSYVPKRVPRKKRHPVQSLPGEPPEQYCSLGDKLQHLKDKCTGDQPMRPLHPVSSLVDKSSVRPMAMLDTGDHRGNQKRHHILPKPNLNGDKGLLASLLSQPADGTNTMTGNPSLKKPRMISLLQKAKVRDSVLKTSSKNCNEVSDNQKKGDANGVHAGMDRNGIESLDRPTSGSVYRQVLTGQSQNSNQVSKGQTPVKVEKCLSDEDMEVASINSLNTCRLNPLHSDRFNGATINFATADRGDMVNIVDTLEVPHNGAVTTTDSDDLSALGWLAMPLPLQFLKTEKSTSGDTDMWGTSSVNDMGQELDMALFEETLKNIKTEKLTSEDIEAMYMDTSDVGKADRELEKAGFETENIEESFSLNEKCTTSEDETVPHWFDPAFDRVGSWSQAASGNVILQQDGQQYMLQRIHSPVAEMADTGEHLIARDDVMSPGVIDTSSLLEFIHSIVVPYLHPLLDEDSDMYMTNPDFDETKNAVAALLACM